MKRWTTLRHHGIAFPPPYDYRGLTIRIKNENFTLNAEQEEMLMAWAKKKDTPYVQDPVFQNNFLQSLRRVLPGDYTLTDLDLSSLFELVDLEKKTILSPEEKKERAKARKAQRAELKATFGFAEVDGVTMEIGAYFVEPPGLFMGRGAHPLRGRWKARVQPEDVILNLDEDAPAPPAPEGHRWGKIVSNHDSIWIACWPNQMNGHLKYVWLADSSDLRQTRDREKYAKAGKLESNIFRVRRAIAAGMKNPNPFERQTATVCCLIDRLAMRVGDEKDEEEADTVGASTLRVEHIRFGEDQIEFNFLGKDSVEWKKTLPLDREGQALARNLQDFMVGKAPGDRIFDQVDSLKVNRFLSRIMPGLTAKVFRTYLATQAVRDFLLAHPVNPQATPAEKEYVARLANLEAAKVCHHKRTPPKGWEEKLAERAAQAQTEAARRKVELAILTRDYALGTSLKNYIDPRVYKAWADCVGFDWKSLYPKTLQRKFAWVDRAPYAWKTLYAAALRCAWPSPAPESSETGEDR
jgi:DNA topoisomerase-1